jgi:MFS transporter, ACS family, glucarate transporter
LWVASRQGSMRAILETTPHTIAAVRPTHARYGVVGLAVALGMVTYLDRVCISTLAKDIMRDLSLSQEQMSYVFSAFTLAYAIFEIPTAAWADRKGTRSVLTRIVVWWSSLTMATAAAASYSWLLATRFLFGAGEAGAWPCVASTFSRWIPARERGSVQGIFFAGAHLSGGLTPLLVIVLMDYLPWRLIFVVFGLVGFAWAVVWYLWYRDDPARHAGVNATEWEVIVAGRRPAAPHAAGWQYWRRLLGHRNTLPLCLMYVGNSYAFYFCITWLPTYLEEQHGVTRAMLGMAAGLPLTLSVVGDLSGGAATDRLSRRFGLRVGRSALGAAAYALAAGAMLLAATTARPVVAVVALSVAVAAVMFTLGAAWGTCIDIGGRHTGVVSAMMNTAGNAGGIFSPIIAVYAKNYWGGWNAPLYLMSGVFLVGTLCWCLIDPRRQVFD